MPLPSRLLEWIEDLPLARDRPAAGYGFALATTLVALGIRHAADVAFPVGFPVITFFPVIMVTAFLYGHKAGILAAFLSWLAARYYFMTPAYSLSWTPGIAVVTWFYLVVAALEIGVVYLLQRANRDLQGRRQRSDLRTEQREMMFRELQHRVSNMLQIIASLLTLQKRTTSDVDAKKALDEAARRVGMVGRISRALHDPDRRGLGVQAFLEQVGHDIIETSGANNVTLTVKADPRIEFDSSVGVPVALVIAEAISNALEHGFGASGNGHIRIEVGNSDVGDTLVVVTDNGAGLPPGFDPTESGSLGLRIALTLTRQIGGTFALRPAVGGGTEAELRLRSAMS
jgi:two-component sensor histidine kinase